MKNLIEQASTWLQSDACRSGNIIERTKAVVSAFRSYVHVEEQEICTKTGLKLSLILDKIDTTEKTVCQILSAFLRGNQQDALMKTYKMMKSMKLDKISPGIPMYKCRENSKLFHFSKDEMFHIPYNKRNLVGNQRFSLSGLPCLYLGGSSYICWEELGRTELNSTNYCGYSLGEDVKMFDFLLPIEITNPHQIRKIVLILACSLAASRDSIFKPEYILSQSILHTLIYRSYYSHSQICLRFYSSHLLNGDADYFNADYDNKAVGNAKNMELFNNLAKGKFSALSATNPPGEGISITDFLSGLVSKIGSEVQSINNAKEAQDAVTEQASSQRDILYGVDLDEELADLIRFQRSYEASARVFNVANELMQLMVQLGK